MLEMFYVKCLVVGYDDIAGDPVLVPVVIEANSEDLIANNHRKVVINESGLSGPTVVIDSRYEVHEELLKQYEWGEAPFIGMDGEDKDYPDNKKFRDWLYDE
jgi:hypothetical protein